MARGEAKRNYQSHRKSYFILNSCINFALNNLTKSSLCYVVNNMAIYSTGRSRPSSCSLTLLSYHSSLQTKKEHMKIKLYTVLSGALKGIPKHATKCFINSMERTLYLIFYWCFLRSKHYCSYQGTKQCTRYPKIFKTNEFSFSSQCK